MVTKTLTIMEDAYKVLKQNKLEGESFSEEIRRVFTEKKKKKRPLSDFFGILNDAKGMQKDFADIRELHVALLKQRQKNEGC
jgi:predicted CopG family antitoxin